ncbi:Skp1 family, dimerization domain-containing protein [Scheffersomyces amazonensis]|uniref:Skp1 family, dimerization domain-containing protein n=1 Tax=Scheffersomyces amazonensis TaxID=1078765 RepID=UPI00315C95FE
MARPKVTLVSSDGETFIVEQRVAERSITIKSAIEFAGVDGLTADIEIPLLIEGKVLKKVVEWCEHYKTTKFPEPDENQVDVLSRPPVLTKWDNKFFRLCFEQDMMFEIIMAANYLNINQLLHVGCTTVANMMKGNSTEQIRELFNVPNDFTPEEEAAIKREDRWTK